ncbi:MAG: ribosome small subunit-dependent GTPase A [Candidatus Cloacimonetes bacterium]|nr:ribosome small subunit-dependent GTPase A [Candidatus Cloacimonadota bacterium]
MKKKEKKKFIRKNLRYRNIGIRDLEKFEDDEIIEEKRAEKKVKEKGEISLKSDLQLTSGKVLNVHSNYRILVEIEGKNIECTLSGRLKQINFETRNVIAVGDIVNVQLSKPSRIEEILPRENALSRFAEDSFQTEIIVAANIDQVIITTSVKEPYLKLGLIDRYICSALLGNIEPIICVNKIDLEEDIKALKEIMNFYRENGYKIIYTSAFNKNSILDLKKILKNKESVFSGHSGTGKSSLINLLQPGLNLRVSNVSSYTKKGAHTTTSSSLIKWDFGGYLIDTPGIKTFSLHKNHIYDLPKVFPGFDKYIDYCKFPDCTHTHEKNCAVKNAIENGEFPEERYDSYLNIYDSLKDLS